MMVLTLTDSHEIGASSDDGDNNSISLSFLKTSNPWTRNGRKFLFFWSLETKRGHRHRLLRPRTLFRKRWSLSLNHEYSKREVFLSSLRNIINFRVERTWLGGRRYCSRHQERDTLAKSTPPAALRL
jgi:hypothetical protein